MLCLLCSLPVLPAEYKACMTKTVGCRNKNNNKKKQKSQYYCYNHKSYVHPAPNSTLNPTK